MKPHPLEISKYNSMLEQFRSESDRGAAVLAGSWVENIIGIYLEHKMVDQSASHELFSSNGPLATFSQRISIGSAFGLISKNTADTLNYIRKIRNHFAHYPLEASFDERPVSEWAQHLMKLLEEQLNSYTGMNSREGNKNETLKLKYSCRDVYLLSCGLFSTLSLSEMKDKKKGT